MEQKPKFNHLNPSVLIIGILLVFSLSACQQSVPAGQRFSSEKAVNIEAFMPVDTFLLAKIGTRDQDQLDVLKTLNGYFPNDPMGAFVTEFNQGFKESANLDKMNLDYEKDILPILNNKSQFFFSMSPGKDVSLASKDTTSASPKVNFNIAMTVADEGKFDALLDKQTANNLLKKEDYNGQTIYSEINKTDTSAYLSRYMDTVFMSTNQDLLKAGLDNVKANKDLLADNKVFQRGMSSYKPNMAIVYANLGEVIKLLGASEGKNSEEMAKALSGMDIENIESEILMMTAENNGIRIASKVFAKSGVDISKTKSAANMQAYLFKKIPAVAPIFYLEGSGLKISYEKMILAFGSDPEFTSGMTLMKDFLKTKGLDWEKDVLSFMDKGIAIVFEDTGTPIPGIGIYLDANSNLDGATKVALAINNGFDDLMAQALKESSDISMVLSKEEVKPGKLWKFKVNLDTVLTAAPSEIAKKLTGQKVELYYGLLDDGVMAITLKPDLEKIYAKDQMMEKNPEFSQAMKLVNGEHRGLAYFAPVQVVQLVDSYLKLIKDATGQAPTIPDYDSVKAAIMPLKSLIFSGGEMKADELSADFFLHIAQ